MCVFTFCLQAHKPQESKVANKRKNMYITTDIADTSHLLALVTKTTTAATINKIN